MEPAGIIEAEYNVRIQTWIDDDGCQSVLDMPIIPRSKVPIIPQCKKYNISMHGLLNNSKVVLINRSC